MARTYMCMYRCRCKYITRVSSGANDTCVVHARTHTHLEDARAHEDAVNPKLHEQAHVRGGREASRGESDDREAASGAHGLDEIDWYAELLGICVDLVITHVLDHRHLGVHGARVAHLR